MSIKIKGNVNFELKEKSIVKGEAASVGHQNQQ